jgi:hypothetical protein
MYVANTIRRRFVGVAECTRDARPVGKGWRRSTTCLVPPTAGSATGTMSRQRQRVTRCRCLRYAESELDLGATANVCTEVDPIAGRATFVTDRHPTIYRVSARPLATADSSNFRPAIPLPTTTREFATTSPYETRVSAGCSPQETGP